MKKLNLSEIKNHELDMLIEFDKLCKKNNLYYVLCGGTLLGAIRHKGFIPWDDDIDVLMPRKDFDRLLNGTDIDFSDFPKNYTVANWKKGLKFPFIKILDENTEVAAKYVANDCENRIWIDVFAIDGNPEDKKELDKLYKKSLRLRKILLIKSARIGEGKKLYKKILKPFLKVIFLVLPYKWLCRKIDDNSKKYDFDKSKRIGGVLWGYGTQERINKEKFMESIQVEFEGKEFNAPSNYDEYLSNLYGDYMQLPPVEKRVTHDIVAYLKE